jgi:ABC-2 type transport system ATP-binding protein
MEEAEYLCDIVAIVDKGRIIAQGSPKALIDSHTQGTHIVLPVDRCVKFPDHNAFEVSKVGEKVVIKAEDANAVVQFLIKEGVDLTHMSIQTPTLETVFLNLTGRQLRD